MLIKRMDRLILAEIIPVFVFGVLLFTSLFFTAGELLRLAQFTSLGVSYALVGRLMLLTLPYIVALTFPMAMLLAALLGFGRLSSDGEIVALVAAGVRFERIVVPVALFGLATALVGLWFADAVVPAANRQRERLYKQIGQSAPTSVGASGGGFTVPVRNKETGALELLVHVEGGVDITRGEIRNVSIGLWKNGRQFGFLWAQRGNWKVGTRDWTLSDLDGIYQTEQAEKNYVVVRADAGDSRENALLGLGPGKTLRLGTPQEVQTQDRPAEQASVRDLRKRVRSLRATGAITEARDAEVEIARRVSLPFAALVFALVGAPLGVSPRRTGKGVGFGLAVLIIFAYWVSFQMTLLLGKGGQLPPLVAAALPNVAGLVAAFFLNRRVLR